MRDLKIREMKHFILSGLLLFIQSCGQTKLSDIEVIKLDTKVIDDLKRTSDTAYTEEIGRADFFTVDYYINYKDSVTTKILKDSLGNVVGLNKSKNDKVFLVAEYFPNGQIKRKLREIKNGELDGLTRYYYEDGRIRSEGQFKNGLWSGQWKEYDKDGHLISIDEYGEGNVNPIKTTKVK